jgi:2-polyprenyl-3-methyl-5-hydroxy-6-metoxy-1,4-benzoquinol methylase
MVNISRLQDRCLFCDPAVHGQESQILLRSDNFYLFAGTGPMIEGGIIIAPYHCDDPETPFHTFSDIPLGLLDEVTFLRSLISDFYREAYDQEASMHFEHGRAGSCFPHSGNTKHCYHAHLCCYPRSFPLWDDMDDLTMKDFDGLPELSQVVESNPYLMIQSSHIDHDVSGDSALRESWRGKIAIMDGRKQIPSQYLRRLLAGRLGNLLEWDWALFPQTTLVQALISTFHNWLTQTHKYELVSDVDGIAKLDFVKSVEKSNRLGNNNVAQDFHQTWVGRTQYRAIGKFLTQLPQHQIARPKILDFGCGPGHYLKAFYALGLECVGFDVSEEMVDLARKECKSISGISGSNNIASPQIENMSFFDIDLGDEVFDGIWCSAAVVHVPRRMLPTILSRLHNLLKKNGALYISALMGSGSSIRREGRVFFYYSEDELKRYFGETSFVVVEQWSDETAISARGGTRRKDWMHFLLKRKRDAE